MDVAKEVVQHFTADPNAQVTIKLEIEARCPDPKGFPEPLRRTVRTNCDVLRFELAEFEEE